MNVLLVYARFPTTYWGFQYAMELAGKRATLPPLVQYWSPGVDVSGIHELVGNALIMDGENERTTDIRGVPAQPKKEEQDDV